MKRFISIRTKLFYSITAAVVSVLLLSGIVSYSYFRRVLRDQVLADQQQLIQACADNIQGLLDELDRISYYLAGDQSVAEILNQNDAGNTLDAFAVSSLSSQITRYVQAPYSASPVSFHFVLYLSGQYRLSSYLGSTMPERLSNPRVGSVSIQSENSVTGRSWYQQSQQLSGSLYSFVLEDRPDVIYFSRTVQNLHLANSNHGSELGTLVFAVNHTRLSSVLTQSTVFEGSQVYLAYQDQILCSNGEALELQHLSERQEFSQLQAQTAFQFLSVDGTDFYGAKKSLGNGLSLLYLVPTREIYRSLNGMGLLIGLELFIAVLIGLGVTAFLTYHFTKPILYLTSRIQKVDNPQSPILVSEEKCRNDEIGILFRRYNEMMQRISLLMADIKTTMQLQKNAEIQALQAQINPHFVFNTLDSINWIALCEKKRDISLMVTSLAKMLRYSICGGESNTALKDELEYLREYCKIQELRYPGEFSVSICISPDLQMYSVPKMLLQPLVENAILHFHTGQGETVTAPLKILVTSEIGTDCLLLRVCDTGPGDPDRINGYLEGRETLIPKGGGFGIRNVNRRIKLQWGDSYGLHYSAWEDPQEGAGVMAELRLPQPGQKDTLN